MSARPWIAEIPETAHDGDATAFGVSVDLVSLRDGTKFRCPSPGVTAIVGGNNVGKSTVLREIRGLLELQRGVSVPPLKLLESITLERQGRPQDVLEWLGSHAPYRQEQHGSFFHDGANAVYPQHVYADWQDTSYQSLGPLSPFVVFYADAVGRLTLADPVEQRADIGSSPEHPLHYLQDSPALLAQVQQYSREIFGQRLTLDRLSRLVALRVGQPGVPAPPVDAVSDEYRVAVTSLPHLHQQGDGMRSLLGLLLPLVSASHQVVIVDEPEAFLHPPQARALGSALSKLAKERGLQVVLATHDRNVLAGLLDVGDVDVAVVRLARDGDTTEAHQLDPLDVRAVWASPELQYSNAIEGLFHQLVVIAEGDQDCRFFGSAVEAASDRAGFQVLPSEVLFVPSGGKAAIPKLASALRNLHVPVVVTPDLDVLNNEALMRSIVTAVGGEWASVGDLYRRVVVDFTQPRDPVTCGDVLTAVEAILEHRRDEAFDHDVQRELRAQIRLRESPWKALKLYGDRAFKGEAATAAEGLFAILDEIGVVIVKVGELENFASIGVSKGPAWLPAALEAEAHAGIQAQEHARRLMVRSV